MGRLSSAFAALTIAWAVPAEGAETPRPFTARVVQSGHSLTDPVVPALIELVRVAGGPRNPPIARSTVPGSPMDWRWERGVAPGMPDARRDIAGYDVLVLTERVPLSGTMAWHDSEGWALRWAEHAWTEGAGGRGAATILYATWVELSSGRGERAAQGDPEGRLTFRERLPVEAARWTRIRDHVNAGLPAGAPPVIMIPGPAIMAAAYDDIAAGRAPGFARIEDLFSDDIHVNAAGAYLIALSHYAAIYGRDPRELPDRVGLPAGVQPAQAAWMQDLVRRVLEVGS